MAGAAAGGVAAEDLGEARDLDLRGEAFGIDLFDRRRVDEVDALRFREGEIALLVARISLEILAAAPGDESSGGRE